MLRSQKSMHVTSVIPRRELFPVALLACTGVVACGGSGEGVSAISLDNPPAVGVQPKLKCVR